MRLWPARDQLELYSDPLALRGSTGLFPANRVGSVFAGSVFTGSFLTGCVLTGTFRTGAGRTGSFLTTFLTGATFLGRRRRTGLFLGGLRAGLVQFTLPGSISLMSRARYLRTRPRLSVMIMRPFVSRVLTFVNFRPLRSTTVSARTDSDAQKSAPTKTGAKIKIPIRLLIHHQFNLFHLALWNHDAPLSRKQAIAFPAHLLEQSHVHLTAFEMHAIHIGRFIRSPAHAL